MTGLQEKIITDPLLIRQYAEILLQEIYTPDELVHKQQEQYNETLLDHVVFIFKNDQPLAKAAVYLNPYIRVANKKTGLIGNYECVADTAVSGFLMKYIESWAKENECAYILGPMNGSTWDQYRFALKFDTPPFFTEDYVPAYYVKQFMQMGFNPVANYYSHVLDRENGLNKNNGKEAERMFREKGMQMREISTEHFERDITLIYELSASAFQNNFLFSPVTLAYFTKKYLPVKNIIDPQLVLLVFDSLDQLVAFIFCLPDIYHSDSKTVVVKSIARHNEPAYAGISRWLFPEILERSFQKGYSRIINAFMHEENISSAISKQFRSQPYRTYQLFLKQIT